MSVNVVKRDETKEPIEERKEESKKKVLSGKISLPPELWEQVFRFNEPREIANLTATSKPFKNLVNEYAEPQLKPIETHPFLQTMRLHSKFLKNVPLREQISLLDRYLKFAKEVKTVVQGGSYLRISFSRDVKILQEKLAQRISLEPFNSKPSFPNQLKRLTSLVQGLSWDDLFLAALLKKDDPFFSQFSLDIIDTKHIDYAAYFSLVRGKIGPFNELLKHTSIFSDDPEKALDVLGSFMGLAIRQNQMDVFQSLISLRKPFSQNKILVEAAERNCPEAIQKLFASGLNFDETFIEDNGLNAHDSHTPGLHTALMIAANRNLQGAMNAILTRPAIDRRILEHVRDGLQNHAAFEQPIHIDDWRDREANLNRDAIVLQLNQEIARRFPPAV